MDWFLKTTMKDRAGIECLAGEKLCDLDFADDIALLENSWEGMQTTTSEHWKRRRRSLDWSLTCSKDQDHDCGLLEINREN